MEPIFDNQGKLAGWLDGAVVRDTVLRHRAFVAHESVYSYRDGKCLGKSVHSYQGGKYLGRFAEGFLRDKSGRAVTFLEDAAGGPILPTCSIPAVPGVPPAAPVAPVPVVPPVPPPVTIGWSPQSWESFLDG